MDGWTEGGGVSRVESRMGEERRGGKIVQWCDCGSV